MYDVRLIMAHYDLHKEERRLAELLEAMKSINDVLTSSHTRLDEPLQTRGDRLDDLHSRTKDMQDQLGEIAYDVVEQGKIDYSANEWLERAFQSHISEIERLQDVLEQAVGEKGHLTQVLEEASEPGYWSSFAPRLAALFGRRKAEVESRHSSADTSRRSSLS